MPMQTQELISLPRETIDDLFARYNVQSDVWSRLYEIAFENWQCIERVEGYPRVSAKTGRYLFEKFIEFDRKHHPDVIAGGLWLNRGFSSGDDVEDWKIDISRTSITYKPCFQKKEK